MNKDNEKTAENQQLDISQLKDYEKKSVEETVYWDAKRREFVNDLLHNERYKKFFSQYSETSVHTFIENYSQQKYFWLRFGPFNKEQYEKRLLAFRDKAEEALMQIQQKKLFNLQCQWRAYQIELPGINSTWDFVAWEHNILNCPLVEPITEKEVDTYIQFLKSLNFSEQLEMFQAWQDYDEMKENYSNDEKGYYPEWYDFFDSRFGTNGLLLLPDIRGEEEQHYRSVNFNEEKQIVANKIASGEIEAPKPVVRDTRPRLVYYPYKHCIDFARQFDSNETVELAIAYEREQNTFDNEMDLESALQYLQDAEEVIPIDGYYDWRFAVINAVRKHSAECTAAAIPEVYKEYLFRIQSGLAFDYDIEEFNSYLQMAENVYGQIVKGKKISEQE